MSEIAIIEYPFHHFAWLAGFIVCCFAAAATLIVWRESSKREAAEHTAAHAFDAVRLHWRPLDTTTPRAFRPIKFCPPPARGRWRAAPVGVSPRTEPSPRARVLESDLRRAAYLAPEQFTITFTAYYDTTTHTQTGLHAVPMWQHPAYGAIDAQEFIPIANFAGITTAVFMAITRAALISAGGRKQEAGSRISSPLPPATSLPPPALYLPLPIAVADWPQAPHALRLLCASCNVPPESITFCITEPCDYDCALALRAQGFGLALANCRAATHTALQRLPLTALIADATLTQNLHTSPAALAMLHSMAALGHSLGITLLADDIDTAADAAALNSSGFTAAAGGFFTNDIPHARVA